MNRPHRLELIHGSADYPQPEQARSSALVVLAMLVAVSAGGFAGSPLNALPASRTLQRPGPVAAETAAYFPAQYVNHGVDIPSHVESF
jgi:hypothetical protein